MHDLCIFLFFVQKSFLTKNCFLTFERSIVYLSCCFTRGKELEVLAKIFTLANWASCIEKRRLASLLLLVVATIRSGDLHKTVENHKEKKQWMEESCMKSSAYLCFYNFHTVSFYCATLEKAQHYKVQEENMCHFPYSDDDEIGKFKQLIYFCGLRHCNCKVAPHANQ